MDQPWEKSEELPSMCYIGDLDLELFEELESSIINYDFKNQATLDSLNINSSMQSPCSGEKDFGNIDLLKEILETSDIISNDPNPEGNSANLDSSGLLEPKKVHDAGLITFDGSNISNSQNDSSNDIATSTSPKIEQTRIVGIKRSSKKKEGHYKSNNDAIVTKYFSAVKGNRIIFETVESISHGDSIKIFIEAQNLGKEDTPAPRLLLDTDIPDESRCSCFSCHSKSPFCVSSKTATVDWSFSDNHYIATLKPVNSDKLDFGIGIWSTNFGKKHAAKLVFQLNRDGQSSQQEYFIKTCAYLGRDLPTLEKTIEMNFSNRSRWFKDGPVAEEYEPKEKKIRLNHSFYPSEGNNPLLVHCPSKNASELYNLLEMTDSKYVIL